MKKPAVLLVFAGVVCVLAAACGMVGCEEANGTVGLNVTPAYVDFREVEDNSVTFSIVETSNTVSGLSSLSLPLEWTVANASLGVIAGASGTQATYIRTRATGVNIVTVRDQYGSEGSATVQQ